MKMRIAAISLLLFCLAALPALIFAQAPEVETGDIEVTSGGQVYSSYLAAPISGGPYPAIILIHSFRGLEEGYRTMTDQLAAEGFVVLAVDWQSFEQSPRDATVKQLCWSSKVKSG